MRLLRTFGELVVGLLELLALAGQAGLLELAAPFRGRLLWGRAHDTTRSSSISRGSTCKSKILMCGARWRGERTMEARASMDEAHFHLTEASCRVLGVGRGGGGDPAPCVALG